MQITSSCISFEAMNLSNLMCTFTPVSMIFALRNAINCDHSPALSAARNCRYTKYICYGRAVGEDRSSYNNLSYRSPPAKAWGAHEESS